MTSRLKKGLRLAFALGVVGMVAGCDTIGNMFNEKDTPLEGERRPVPRVAPPPPENVPQPLSALPENGSSNLA